VPNHRGDNNNNPVLQALSYFKSFVALIDHPITACPGAISSHSSQGQARQMSFHRPTQAQPQPRQDFTIHASTPPLTDHPAVFELGSYNMPKQPIILSSARLEEYQLILRCTLYYRSSDLRPDRHHVSTFSIFHRRLLTKPLSPSRLSMFSPLPVLGSSRSDTYHVLTCEKYPHSFHHFTSGRSSSDKASVAGLH